MNPNRKRAEAAAKTATSLDKAAAYSLLRSPVITEKASNGQQFGQFTFKVSDDATKPAIKRAVELLYGVKVQSVNTLVQNGKQKRFRGRLGIRPGYKKAIVKLNAGETIDVSTTL